MGLWPRQQRVDPQFDQLIPESRLARFLDEAIEVRRVSLKVNDGVRGIFQTAGAPASIDQFGQHSTGDITTIGRHAEGRQSTACFRFYLGRTSCRGRVWPYV